MWLPVSIARLAALAMLLATACAFPPIVEAVDGDGGLGVCGDRRLDANEECDDGVFNSDFAPDGCRTSCRRAFCGDGVVDFAEECDPAQFTGVACSAECRIDHCGDGVVDPGEACDDGDRNSDTAPGACRTRCRKAACGDGVVDPGEACDPKPGEISACDARCRVLADVPTVYATCAARGVSLAGFTCADAGDGVLRWLAPCPSAGCGRAWETCRSIASGSFCVPDRCGAGAWDGPGANGAPFASCRDGGLCHPTFDPSVGAEGLLCSKPGPLPAGMPCSADVGGACAGGLACEVPPIGIDRECATDADCSDLRSYAYCSPATHRCAAVGVCSDPCDPANPIGGSEAGCVDDLASCVPVTPGASIGACRPSDPREHGACLHAAATFEGLTCGLDSDGTLRWLRACAASDDCRAFERCELGACVQNRCADGANGALWGNCSGDGVLLSGASDGSCLLSAATSGAACWGVGSVSEGFACRQDAAGPARCGAGLACASNAVGRGAPCLADGECPGAHDAAGTMRGGYCDRLSGRCDLLGECRRPCDVTLVTGDVCSAGGACVPTGGAAPGWCAAEGQGDDPLYPMQWHLHATSANGGLAGEDTNVEGAWAQGLRGEGVTIAVVDDGLEVRHEDLRANVIPGLSHDYTTGGSDPTGGDHGTSCAGVAGARDLNGKGVRGVSPRAGLVGFNVLMADDTVNEVDAETRLTELVSIYTNSWGPPDGDAQLTPSEPRWQQAIEYGLAFGRGGKGAIYTWAAGNGGDYREDSNYDGYANYRGVMAIGAVGANGRRASYSEPGANVWVCTPSLGDDGHGIVTADRTGTAGYNDGSPRGGDLSDAAYTKTFSGTSSATPAAAGVAALVLQANPQLSWRDVRQVLAVSARKNDPTSGDWTTNGAGHVVGHDCGFGVVDAMAAVNLARTWTPLPRERSFATPTLAPMASIPDNDPAGVVVKTQVAGSGVSQLEWVEVFFDSEHVYAGDLQLTLRHESTGTESVLARPHQCSGRCAPYANWRFGTGHHLDEAADGEWSLSVVDAGPQDTGRIRSWRLVLHGH